jgi:hypothetical protein
MNLYPADKVTMVVEGDKIYIKKAKPKRLIFNLYDIII